MELNSSKNENDSFISYYDKFEKTSFYKILRSVINAIIENIVAIETSSHFNNFQSGNKKIDHIHKDVEEKLCITVDGFPKIENSSPGLLLPLMLIPTTTAKRSNLKRQFEDVQSDAQESSVKRKCISFDDVTVYYFSRAQGFTCVPSQGGSTLGMESQHSHVEKFSIAEHAAEQRKAHREMLFFHRQQKLMTESQEQSCIFSPSEDSSSGESQSEDDNSDYSESETDMDSFYFMQPVSTRQRRVLLKASGVKKIDTDEKNECHSIRASRKYCGCYCKIICDPVTCICSQAGIKCQVDRLNFPCGCTSSGCGNVYGRIEFNPVRVRTHFIDTLTRLQMSNKNDHDHWAYNGLKINENGHSKSTTDDSKFLIQNSSSEFFSPLSPFPPIENIANNYYPHSNFNEEKKNYSYKIHSEFDSCDFSFDRNLCLHPEPIANGSDLVENSSVFSTCLLQSSKLFPMNSMELPTVLNTNEQICIGSDDFSEESFDSFSANDSHSLDLNHRYNYNCSSCTSETLNFPYDNIACYGNLNKPATCQFPSKCEFNSSKYVSNFPLNSSYVCVGYSCNPNFSFINVSSSVSFSSASNISLDTESLSFPADQKYTILQSIENSDQFAEIVEVPSTFVPCIDGIGNSLGSDSNDSKIMREFVTNQQLHDDENTSSSSEINENFGEIIKNMVETVSV